MTADHVTYVPGHMVKSLLQKSLFILIWLAMCKVFYKYQRGDLMDKTLGLSGGRTGVRISGQGKCSLKAMMRG